MTLDVITTEELAVLTHTTPNTVRYWKHIGKGPKAFKLGKRVVYRREDVETWVNEQYLKANPA
jgi:predicted DNA-binding transcriptional regulator AlpA